ncbi:MAG: hypothetical protein U5K54_09820 [Cytophagales bacterium]|nr:hypothetical protein [Cytophagales bacterium]
MSISHRFTDRKINKRTNGYTFPLSEMDEDEFINPKDLPIYKKGQEIFDVVHQIAELVPDDNEHLQSVKGFMILDAARLTVKIAVLTRWII